MEFCISLTHLEEPFRLAKFRYQKNIALAIASSGIAATPLDGGRTAHSALKLTLKPQF